MRTEAGNTNQYSIEWKWSIYIYLCTWCRLGDNNWELNIMNKTIKETGLDCVLDSCHERLYKRAHVQTEVYGLWVLHDKHSVSLKAEIGSQSVIRHYYRLKSSQINHKAARHSLTCAIVRRVALLGRSVRRLTRVFWCHFWFWITDLERSSSETSWPLQSPENRPEGNRNQCYWTAGSGTDHWLYWVGQDTLPVQASGWSESWGLKLWHKGNLFN